MMSCRDISQYISRSADRPLTLICGTLLKMVHTNVKCMLFGVNGLKHAIIPVRSFESHPKLNQRAILTPNTAQATFT